MESSFIKRIAAQPGEGLHRLAFADWLDEAGRHAGAELERSLAAKIGSGKPVGRRAFYLAPHDYANWDDMPFGVGAGWAIPRLAEDGSDTGETLSRGSTYVPDTEDEDFFNVHLIGRPSHLRHYLDRDPAVRSYIPRLILRRGELRGLPVSWRRLNEKHTDGIGRNGRPLIGLWDAGVVHGPHHALTFGDRSSLERALLESAAPARG